MPERIRTTMSGLTLDDYIEGKGGAIWKVIREAHKEDGRYLGLQNQQGEKMIQKADERPVTTLVYGAPTMEEAVATVAEKLGGKVLVERREQVFIHPSHAVLEADQHMLAAHLVRFHQFADLTEDMRLGDLIVNHRAAHNDGRADHTHTED